MRPAPLLVAGLALLGGAVVSARAAPHRPQEQPEPILVAEYVARSS